MCVYSNVCTSARAEQKRWETWTCRGGGFKIQIAFDDGILPFWPYRRRHTAELYQFTTASAHASRFISFSLKLEVYIIFVNFKDGFAKQKSFSISQQ